MSEQLPKTDEVRSIRETNAEIRALIERETLEEKFWVGGIVRSLYLSDRGHSYFDLEDDDYSLRCMVREPVRGTIGFTIANGIDIEVFGFVRVYDKTARLEFEVQKARLTAQPAVIPAPAVFDQLEKQGLWPRTMPRPLPDPIRAIALITSRYSDAERDFNSTYRTERGAADIKTIDVRTQGQGASAAIAAAIQKVNRERAADVIALVRGGGRQQDIAVFNDFLIVEAICRSSIPVVTGIGHQPDHTYSDDVADISTITPTAAALQSARWPEKVKDESPMAASTVAPIKRFNDRWLLVITALIILIALAGLFLLVLFKH